MGQGLGVFRVSGSGACTPGELGSAQLRRRLSAMVVFTPGEAQRRTRLRRATGHSSAQQRRVCCQRPAARTFPGTHSSCRTNNVSTRREAPRARGHPTHTGPAGALHSSPAHILHFPAGWSSAVSDMTTSRRPPPSWSSAGAQWLAPQHRVPPHIVRCSKPLSEARGVRVAASAARAFAASCCTDAGGALNSPIGRGAAAAVPAPGIGDRPRPRSEGARGGNRPATRLWAFRTAASSRPRPREALCTLALPLEAKGSNPRSPRAMPSACMGRR
jgi:hypothetical protein